MKAITIILLAAGLIAGCTTPLLTAEQSAVCDYERRTGEVVFSAAEEGLIFLCPRQ